MITAHNPVSLEDLRKISCLHPKEAGAYWQGIPHGILIDTLFDLIDQRWLWHVSALALEVNNDGLDLVASMNLEIPEHTPPDGMKFSIGLTTSNSRSRRLRIYSGVTIGTVGIVLGELMLCRKHVIGFDLRRELDQTLDDFVSASRSVPRAIGRLTDRVLDREEYHSLLMTAGRRHLMPWSRLGRIDVLCGPGAHTSWEVLVAFATVVQMNPTIKQMNQVHHFKQLLPTAFETLSKSAPLSWLL